MEFRIELDVQILYLTYVIYITYIKKGIVNLNLNLNLKFKLNRLHSLTNVEFAFENEI